ncbi:MAG: hypothetical protein AB7D24_11390, partial [Sphaerochaeta sp.]
FFYPLTRSEKKGVFADWKKAHALVCVSKHMVHNVTGKTTDEVRYYLTSLKDIADAAHCIRAHWNILCEIYFNEQELGNPASQIPGMQVV